MAGTSNDAKLLGRFRLAGPIVIGPQDHPDVSLTPALGGEGDYSYSVFQDTNGDATTITLAFPTADVTAFVAGATQNT